MADIEKVIKALDYCTHSDDCLGCIHWQKVAKGEKCTVRDDALALLKEQGEEIENLKQTAQSMMEGICLLKEHETANVYKCPNCGTWVSAENVVRCRDCRWRGTNACFCKARDDVQDNWFCSEGERKEGR